MTKVTTGFVFNTRELTVTYTDEDVVGDVDPAVWEKMSRSQRTRYLTARADLDATLYAWEEKIPIVSDFPSRIKQLKAKAEHACQVS